MRMVRPILPLLREACFDVVMGRERCASSRVTTGLVVANDSRFHATQRLDSDFPVLTRRVLIGPEAIAYAK